MVTFLVTYLAKNEMDTLTGFVDMPDEDMSDEEWYEMLEDKFRKLHPDCLTILDFEGVAW